MSRKVATGLEEVEPPTKAAPPVYPAERLEAIAGQLDSSKWLSNGEIYHTRSAAYHHANVLMKALGDWMHEHDRWVAMKIKTWGIRDEYHWAIRKE